MQVVSTLTQKLPETVMSFLRKGGSEDTFQTEFGKGLKISSCDEAAIRLNGDGDGLIDWGTNVGADGPSGFLSKEFSFKWEPDESKPIETRVFEVVIANLFRLNVSDCIHFNGNAEKSAWKSLARESVG